MGYAKFQLLKGPEGLVAGGWKGIKVKGVKERGSNTRALTRRLRVQHGDPTFRGKVTHKSRGQPWSLTTRTHCMEWKVQTQSQTLLGTFCWSLCVLNR